MTANSSPTTSRRPVIIGLGILAVAVFGGALWELPRMLGRHYPPTPYDDLLALLPDREKAARVGAAVLAANPAFDSSAAAGRLRRAIGGGSLNDAAEADLAAGRLLEVQGWVLPANLAEVCALAARPR
jgi:hypothetical protein